MPATVETDPPRIWCMFSDGSIARFSLDGLPCPGLAEDLLTGLAGLIHPHGRVDAAGTAGVYVRAFREMTRTLAAAGFAGRAADLRRPHLTAFWMGTRADRESCTRRALAAFARDGGTLHPAVAELTAGRNFNPVFYHKPLPPYCEAEWERLAATCAAVADASFAAHKEALAAAARGSQPGKGRWSRENVAWLLARTGPVGAARLGRLAGCSPGVARRQSGFQEVSADLFPALDTVIAYRLLFGICSGIVPDGIADLSAGDIDWAGDATILLSYVKRRTSAESLNLPRRAVRLLEQWLSHSALLRSHAGPGDRERLWLGTSHPGGDMLIKKVDRVGIQRWILRHDVTGDDGGPLRIHRSRIRTTHLSLRDKSAWAGRGRATIDPNHSPQVEGDHYLTAATPAQQQSVDVIVADAQHDLIRRAHPPAVLADADTAALARDYPQLAASLGLDDGVLAELVSGTRDVFTAACAGQLAGLHGPKGQPCPARPWVCLLCPLAVFAPRHAVNLLRLKAFFSRQWQQMPAAQFMAVFGPYSQRIGQVLDRFDPAVLDGAARCVPRSAPDDRRRPSLPAAGQVAVRRRRHLPAGRTHAPGRSRPAELR